MHAPVALGIIGRNKMAYELFGTTLRLAESMEGTSKPMQVQCTRKMGSHIKVQADIAASRLFIVVSPVYPVYLSMPVDTC